MKLVPSVSANAIFRGALLLALLVVFGIQLQTATAAGPQTISFQGKVVNADGTNVANGSYNFDFVLYDDPALGSPSDGVHDKWHELTKSTTVTNGVFQTNLGSATPLPDFNANPSLYLAVRFNADAAGYMSPRVQLNSVPYALNADKVGGLATTQLTQLGQGVQSDASTTNASIGINKTGITAKILDLQRSGASVFSVNNDGSVLFKNSTDSTSALLFQNNAGDNILAIDTTGSNQNNLITNDSFEAGTTGWAAKGTTPTTFAQDATTRYNGAASLKITTQATANQGGRFNVTLADSTAYTASFYVRLDPTSIGMATLAAGYSSDGATDNTACAQNTTTLQPSIWIKVVCNFTTPASHSGTPFFYIKQTDAAIHTFNIDGVLLQLAANADTNFRDGKVTLQGIVASPAIFQSSSDSSNALTVQNSAGTDVFTVDTLDTNIITNGGFEVTTTGWAAVGGSTAVSRDPSQSWLGTASLNVTTSATAAAGAKFTTGNVQPTQLAISSTYTISWYSKLSAGAFTDIIAAYARNGSAETNCTGMTSQTVVLTGWTRFTCTITTDGTTPAATAYVIIKQTAGTARTFWIDGAQLEAGSTTTAYGAGNLSLNGVITSPLSIRNQSNSTEAFKVATSGSLNLLTVDTLTSTVEIGSTLTDTNQVLLQLDSFSTLADTATCSTTVNQGTLYYNTNSNAVRACINGGWEDILSTAALGLQLFGVVPDSGNNPGDLTSAGTAGVSGPCKVSLGAAQNQFSIAPCVAYSGGRKVVVAQQTNVTVTGLTTVNRWAHICLNGTDSQPVLSAANAAENATANLPTWSAAAPILCLADIFGSNVTGNNIFQIYDLRTFTTTQKDFITNTGTQLALGQIAIVSTTSATRAGATNGLTTVLGVVVATGTASTTAPSAVISIAGPTWVKATAGTVANYVQTGNTTAGYANTTGTSAYQNMGIARTAYNATCTTAATCAGSLFLNMRGR